MERWRFLTGCVEWSPRPVVYAKGLPPLPDETLDAYLIRLSEWLGRP